MFGLQKLLSIFAMSKERNDNRAGRIPGKFKTLKRYEKVQCYVMAWSRLFS